MKETSKASVRRSHEPAFIQHYFVGDGLDICSADDLLASHAHIFPRMRNVTAWPATKGDLSTMSGAENSGFDFLHAGHVLAGQPNPHKALARWLELVKPDGHVIVTVPDEDLYGKGVWPNHFNGAHRASFTIHKSENRLPRSVNVLEMVQAMSPVANCERIALVRDHFDAARADADQTADSHAECVIEFVLRKRAVPTLTELKHAMDHARNAADAIVAAQTAVRLYPYRFDAYHRAMMTLLRWDVPELLDAMWQQCVECLPDEHLPRLYQALHLIARGKLQEGFTLREALMGRLGWKRRTSTEPPQDVPEWKGESLAGKSIAIWSEFGLGDEIFFLRFADILRDRCGAKRVVVVCQSPLVELYEASDCADDVVDVQNAANMSGIDYWVYPHAILIHLPLELDALPQNVPYLRASEAVASKLPEVAPGKLKVGVVFKGNPTHENDANRSLSSLAVLNDLFRVDGVEFFSLQKGAGADEAAQYATNLDNFHDVGAHLNTMAETASAIAALDLVVTVDTSVAHVAGAMGKPVWLMLPDFGDWRWHYTREDSPWYPTMRLFRRPFGCDWSEVVARMSGHLRGLQAEHASRAIA
ncbi:putative TPR repeat protein [Caballeronia novacaledonica]|uniref:Putative TPR repeat protein n=1 Tax=Caballeronia novacaledonica TaxID=1544861 RepID=A0A2U3I5Q8_9BURK|nr:glycosyltransferase family 9 protein [Caballeronia novacaledonica]SPB15439.1 putative TPR repeat protein [Caballeronia novacaledonica]